MALNSSLYSYYTDQMPWALDEEGDPIEGTLAGGIIQVTHPDHPLPPNDQHEKARHVFHVAPGLEPPPGWAVVVVDGRYQSWTPELMVQLRPDESRYLMEATYQAGADEDGNPIIHRVKEVMVPDGVEPLETGLIPHLWAGEDPFGELREA